jgi:hypothetical protein
MSITIILMLFILLLWMILFQIAHLMGEDISSFNNLLY